MTLDDIFCERAWRTRDPAADGLFFVGVHTTGIYCRPICPVRHPYRHNITFLPSAAAAEAAGFRPCLRCRPESAPFSPAWKGSLTTVERAVRLIVEDGALDDGGHVAGLAERLGMGERHLLRLFRKHLDATPTQVAKTARVQKAKRLISDTDLPMMDIALRSGFGSLRRFNAVFSEVYRMPPSAIRRTPPRLERDAARGAAIHAAHDGTAP